MRAWHFAFLPVVLGNLVAANANALARKQFEDFREHILQERKGGLVARTIDAVEYPPVDVDVVRPPPATEFRIHRQCCAGMTGHLNLGHDSHIPGFRVGDDLPDVPLREETTVAAIRPVGGSLLVIEPETNVLAPSTICVSFG